jgi:hypothetical protein
VYILFQDVALTRSQRRANSEIDPEFDKLVSACIHNAIVSLIPLYPLSWSRVLFMFWLVMFLGGVSWLRLIEGRLIGRRRAASHKEADRASVNQ